MREIGTAHVVRVGARQGAGWLDVVDAMAPPGFDSARDGFCIHRGGTILHASTGLMNLLGRPASAVLGCKIGDLFLPRDRPEVLRLLGAALDGEGHCRAARLDRAPAPPLLVEVLACLSSQSAPAVELLYVLPSSAAGPAGSSSDVQRGSGGRGAGGSGGYLPTVLICDDESRLGALTAGLLSEYGFQSLTVGTGEEALDELNRPERSVDVVLLDVNLSQGSSARDVLQKMKATGASARVVLTSGLAEEDVDLELMAHPSVVGYVAKPYAVEQLVQSLRRALSSEPQ